MVGKNLAQLKLEVQATRTLPNSIITMRADMCHHNLSSRIEYDTLGASFPWNSSCIFNLFTWKLKRFIYKMWVRELEYCRIDTKKCKVIVVINVLRLVEYKMIVKGPKHRKHPTFIGSATIRIVKNETNLVRSESTCSHISNSYLQEIDHDSGITQEVRDEIESRFKFSQVNFKYKFPRSETPKIPHRVTSPEKTSSNTTHRAIFSPNFTPFKTIAIRNQHYIDLFKGNLTDRRTISPIWKPDSNPLPARIKRNSHSRRVSSTKPKELSKLSTVNQALIVHKLSPPLTAEEEMKNRIKRIQKFQTPRVLTPLRNHIK